MPQDPDVQLVYDRDCPVCDFYCKRMDLETGTLDLVDARDDSELLAEITAAGLDIDQGMVLKAGDTFYYGSEAIHELALLSSRRGVFNGLAARLFRSPRLAKALYPPMVGCRNLLLRLLGRSRINNLGKPGNERF